MSQYSPVSSYSDFERRTQQYHSNLNPGDTLAYGWIYKNIHITKRFDLSKLEGMMLVVEGYLANWGGMRRWLLWNTEEGSASSKDIAHNLLDVLENNRQKLKRLNELVLFKDLQNAENDLKEVFDSISRTEIKHKGKSYKLGVVGAGKLMHMLLPKLCIIWDNKYVLDKKFNSQRFPKTSDGYCMYLERKREELNNVIRSAPSGFGQRASPNQIINKIEEQHSRFLSNKGFKDIEEPITKLLDECNAE
ncbi:hypothetical protein MUP01_14585 [Candidatus Bathyarchaeota archaeon]|nr:hypothetical protein [Candidatus Bathyarchaeota archaeon]